MPCRGMPTRHSRNSARGGKISVRGCSRPLRKQEEIAKAQALENEKIATLEKERADSSAIVAQTNAEEALRQRSRAVQQQSIAERNAELARQQEALALEQSDSAKRASVRADQQAAIATEERNRALSLRMLSIGKSMSIKSLQVQGQQDLQTLLAYQAYLFNKKNGGLENDADIYTGLYNVAKQYGGVTYKTFKGHTGAIKSIVYVPNRNQFYTSGEDGKVLKWDPNGKDQTFQVIYSGTDIIEILAINPDASWLACGSSNSSIRMIPLKGNNIQYELAGHSGKIKSLIFSYDGKYLYSASLDGKVLKWDLAARTSTNITTGNIQITSIDISSNGNYLAGLSNLGNVIVWNPENNSDNFRIETSGRNIKILRFKPDDNILALGDINGNVELWDISTRKKISEVKAHNAQVNDIRFNPVLGQMATASNDKTLKIFNNIADLTEPPISFTDNEGWVLVINFSNDGRMVVSGSYEGVQNLIGRPSHADFMVTDICTLVTRNMTPDEWNTYVARDIPLENTCTDKDYNIKVNVIR